MAFSDFLENGHDVAPVLLVVTKEYAIITNYIIFGISYVQFDPYRSSFNRNSSLLETKVQR